MTRFLMKKYALSRQGAQNLCRAIWSCALTDLALMLPVIIFFYLLKNVLKVLDGQNIQQQFVLYTALCLGALAVVAVAVAFEFKATKIASYDESANLRIRIAERLRKLPISFFNQRDLADLTSSIMADCTGMETAFSHYIPQLIGAVISLVPVSVGLFLLDWRLSLALLWVVPVAFLLVAGSHSVQTHSNQRNLQNKLKMADSIQECIETIQELKSNHQEENYARRLDQKIDEVENQSIKSELTAGLFVTGAQMLVRFGIASVVIVGAILYVQHAVSLLNFILFLIAASRVYDPLSAAFANLAGLYDVSLRCERIRNLENTALQAGETTFSPKGYDICFEQVAFSYPGEKDVLRKVSFTARQGAVTALVGPSGGGKSTAAKLAARFWDSSAGRITVGGVDIQKVDPETLLSKYSIVFQNVVLFNQTILENIRIGRRSASDEEVVKAAKAAHCDDFIANLEKGYQTVIGENGSFLSGGERQRISIARAILKDAPIVLLDEATASLDVENETSIQKALSRLVRGKTVLVIAHRLRTVAGADHVVVLAEGKVVEQGSPSELMRQKRMFHKMVQAQNEFAEWSI